MIFIGTYFLIGIVLSIWALMRRRRSRHSGLGPLLWLGEPFFGLALFALWPLWLIVQVFDQSIEEPAAPQEYISEDLTGRTGVVVIELRPTGRVKIDHKLYEARSEGDLLPVGARVVVKSSRLGELLVAKAVGV